MKCLKFSRIPWSSWQNPWETRAPDSRWSSRCRCAVGLKPASPEARSHAGDAGIRQFSSPPSTREVTQNLTTRLALPRGLTQATQGTDLLQESLQLARSFGISSRSPQRMRLEKPRKILRILGKILGKSYENDREILVTS